MKVRIIFALLLITAYFSHILAQTQSKYQLNTTQSKVKWIGRKFLGSHYGSINFKSGSVIFDGERITSGNFEVDMKSIVNEDLTDKSLNQKLVGHLKSDDFFGVEKYPISSFSIIHSTPIKNVKPNEPNLAISGKLTIKGITHTISFPAFVKSEGKTLRAKAALEIDRTKYNVRYGSGSFFDNLGDNVIYDNFTLELDLIFEKI
ncbi:MAG: YceI family protein [Candidatus Kapaibacteriales bacterium]